MGMIKKIFPLVLVAALMFVMTACGSSAGDTPSTQGTSENTETKQDAPDIEDKTASESETTKIADDNSSGGSNVLVVYFSRTGEQYTVGVIDEGNTAIVAKMIAEKTGADTFEILPETDYYPYTYAELTDVAKKEQNENARPVIKDALPNMSQYDTVFVGAPVWWGDWPMIMYTFFESTDLSGKNLIPFSTHEGSGLSGFDKKLSSAVSDAEVLTGLAIRGNDCQNDKAGVESKVDEWLSVLGY